MTATVHRLPVKRLLPASDTVRNAILTSYRAGGITRICTIDQLIRHCGMTNVEAAREVANAF